jgi:hypothetical protein
VNPTAFVLCPVLLALATTAGAQGPSRSTLRAQLCLHRLATDSSAAIRVSVEPRGAHNEYLQLTVFAVRSGQPDSVIAHEVQELKDVVTVPGLYRLRVRSLGYQAAADTLRVSRGQSWCIAARLAAAVPLQPAP